VAISVGQGIAEPVPSETRNLASGFCICLIHQAQLPNKLGNYNVKKSKIKGQNDRAKMKKTVSNQLKADSC